MKSLAILLVFGGYTLVYAATANGGKFASEPWAGLFADAYTTDLTIQPGQPGYPQGGQGPVTKVPKGRIRTPGLKPITG